jgi:DNA polymerase-3 subunit delta
VGALRDRALDAAWASFNYDKIPPDQPDGPQTAFESSHGRRPLARGKRVVWLVDTPLGQRCPEAVLAELERTLPQLPDSTVLLLSSRQKPDGRAKFTKLIQRHGEIKAFDVIPPWKTDQLLAQVKGAAQARQLKLTEDAAQLLAEAVGNQTRQLTLELEKLALYWGERPDPIDAAAVERLVTVSTQSSLQLAAALRQGDTHRALGLVADLLNRNEPALRIVATLVGQFRTWLWVKVMVTAGDRDLQSIAKAAEVGQPQTDLFSTKGGGPPTAASPATGHGASARPGSRPEAGARCNRYLANQSDRNLPAFSPPEPLPSGDDEYPYGEFAELKVENPQCQTSATRSQKSEARSRKLKIRSQKPAFQTLHPMTHTPPISGQVRLCLFREGCSVHGQGS